ncbi:hypothetical protein BOTBODRAFT_173618 [Botryobasidium botryosum FD-172 SS1]|uniref:Uncharacterized protein n=1 Tax=Botryobasidium botryosum (strain FD-172 SS1) TaxID=930990 RepID=A0A067MK96_BOTB1|nr:hypothetical protein BOTBODRAFT_173618 [Botryobasidium botryosum FD-172 SS1]
MSRPPTITHESLALSGLSRQPLHANPHHFSTLAAPVRRAEWSEEDTAEASDDADLEDAKLQLAQLVANSLEFAPASTPPDSSSANGTREKDVSSGIAFRLLSGQTAPLSILLEPKPNVSAIPIRPLARESSKARRIRKKKAQCAAVESDWILHHSRNPEHSQTRPTANYVLSDIVVDFPPLLAVVDTQSRANEATTRTRARCSRLSVNPLSAVVGRPRRHRRRSHHAPGERRPPTFFQPASVLGSRGYAMGWSDPDGRCAGRYARDRMKRGTEGGTSSGPG